MGEIDATCTQCGLFRRGRAACPNMPPSGESDPTLYVVGMAPGRDEDAAGRQFVGKSGRFLRAHLTSGVKARFYNAVNCIPPDNKVKPEELALCSSRVRDDIARARPQRVLALGSEAVRALFPGAPQFTISRLRGATTFLRIGDFSVPVTVTWHPSYIMRLVASEGRRCRSFDLWVGDLKSACDAAPVSVPTQAFMRDEKCVLVRSIDDVRDCFRHLGAAEVVAFDVETTTLKPFKKDGNSGALFSIAFAFPDKVFSMPLGKFWPTNIRESIDDGLRKWLAKPNQTKVAHNVKFDLMWLLVTLRSGDALTLGGRFEDTMLLAALLNAEPGMSGLKVAAWRWLGVPDWSVDTRRITQMPLERVLQYGALDAFYCLRLFALLIMKMGAGRKQDERRYGVYSDLLMPASLELLRIEIEGVPVDKARLVEFESSLDNGIGELERGIQAEAGAGFDMNSPKKVQDYFLSRGYQMLKRTKTGWSVDEESLKHLVDRYDDPVATLLLVLRQSSKLQSTYVRGLRKYLCDDGCLHGAYSLTSTVTGRTSSSEPNMQNFPKRKNREIRELVVAPPGYKLASFDYGQIEARLWGVLSADSEFIDALVNDYDIHMQNSVELFGDDAAANRTAVKGATFAMLYGGGNDKVAAAAGCGVDKIKQLRSMIFSRFKSFRPFINQVETFERKHGYMESLFGRRRRSPMTYTEMLNFPFQSAASDMTLTGLTVLGRKYRAALMIHDDLSFFLPDDDKLLSAVEEIMRVMLTVPWRFMKDSRWFKGWVPLQVECSVGYNWGAQEEVAKVSSFDMGYGDLESSLAAGAQFERELNSG